MQTPDAFPHLRNEILMVLDNVVKKFAESSDSRSMIRRRWNVW